MISSRDMAQRIAKRQKIPAKTVQSVMTGLADELAVAMLRSEEVTLWGVGRFRRRCYKTEKGGVAQDGGVLAQGVAFVVSARIKAKLKEGMSIFDEVEAL